MHSKTTTSTDESTFWSKVDCSGDGCWEWQRGRMKAGYGETWHNKRVTYTHRLAWEYTNGPIPNGLKVLHSCDNRACCRPEHLFLGTDADNVRDMIAKGRNKQGEQAPNARLTEADVRFIRTNHPAMSAHELAERFGVHHNHIHAIISRTWWKHVT